MQSDIKVPTLDVFLSYDGLHCHKLWAEVGEKFVCPSCGRTKFQLLRWTMRFPNKPEKFMGWKAVLHRHHCHSAGRYAAYVRFPTTVICDQCNSADGAAKKKLGLPSNFSFAPYEIAQFVKSKPHGKHEIDYQSAAQIYAGLQSSNKGANE